MTANHYVRAADGLRFRAALVDFSPGLLLTGLAILFPSWILFGLLLVNSLFLFVRDALLTIIFRQAKYRGVSPGKRIYRLQVIDLHRKEPVGIFEALLRNFLFVIPFLNYLVLAVELFFAMRDLHGLRLFDRVAGTAVVAAPSDDDS